MLKLSHVFLATCLLASTSVLASPTSDTLHATLHKDPWCGCCEAYADYLEANAIQVTRMDHKNMTAVKQFFGTDQAASCHTVELGDYVIEGHVPIAAIQKLLTEKPDIKGISVPDMPINSPGMGPEIPGTLPVVTIDKTGQVIGEFGHF